MCASDQHQVIWNFFWRYAFYDKDLCSTVPIMLEQTKVMLSQWGGAAPRIIWLFSQVNYELYDGWQLWSVKINLLWAFVESLMQFTARGLTPPIQCHPRLGDCSASSLRCLPDISRFVALRYMPWWIICHNYKFKLPRKLVHRVVKLRITLFDLFCLSASLQEMPKHLVRR